LYHTALRENDFEGRKMLLLG